MNKCEICRANNICDHYSFGFETCGNYIPTNEWISVEDRLPERNGKYLIYTSRGFIMMSYCLANLNSFERWDVTHWMPLPEPPKGE